MTFYEARLSLQILAEERVGAIRYQNAKDAKEREEALAAPKFGLN